MTNDIANSPTRDMVLVRKNVLRDTAHRIAVAYLTYLSIGEFGPWASFAIQVMVLLNHVSHVIQLAAKEQMGWVDARRGITAMQDTHPIRDRAIMQFPGDAVGKDQSLPPFPYLHTSIAVLITASSPQPAPFGLLNMRPKTLFEGLRNYAIATARSGITRFAAILAPVFGKDALLDFKGALALLALDDNAAVLAEPATSATAKKTFTAFVGNVDKFLSASFTDTNMRRCVKMVLHADSYSVCHASGCNQHRRGIVLLLSPHYTTSLRLATSGS